jgi:phosphoribosylformylglycinamidine synthase
MTLGNRIGVEFDNLTKDELFAFNYGTIILEVKNAINIQEELKDGMYKVVGKTISNSAIVSKEYDLDLNIEALEKTYEEKLKSVFKIKTKDVEEKVETVLYDNKSIISPAIKIAKPRVVIPVFPGNNCEYDCARAFKKEGAEVTQVVFRNITKEALTESIERLAKEISKSQILMIPGGFSAGDEPDGSGKFIANALRNEKISNAVMELLKNRDGLAIGICNGFQALIKLGLVPYGEIVDIKEDMATLTYNNINRHMSSIIQTRVTSNKSPWFSEVNAGDIHSVAISHGEGRFVAPESLVKKLIENGQVATQYVDLEENVSLNMPYNPNGSMYGIEGITSPDGRVLGKMAHSERIGEHVYKNIPGDFDQKIFKSGVNYFK